MARVNYYERLKSNLEGIYEDPFSFEGPYSVNFSKKFKKGFGKKGELNLKGEVHKEGSRLLTSNKFVLKKPGWAFEEAFSSQENAKYTLGFSPKYLKPWTTFGVVSLGAMMYPQHSECGVQYSRKHHHGAFALTSAGELGLCYAHKAKGVKFGFDAAYDLVKRQPTKYDASLFLKAKSLGVVLGHETPGSLSGIGIISVGLLKKVKMFGKSQLGLRVLKDTDDLCLEGAMQAKFKENKGKMCLKLSSEEGCNFSLQYKIAKNILFGVGYHFSVEESTSPQSISLNLKFK